MNASTSLEFTSGRAAPEPALRILGSRIEGADEILGPPVQQLLIDLHRRFDARRQELLTARRQRQEAHDAGVMPDFCLRRARCGPTIGASGRCRRICAIGASRSLAPPTEKW